jgi:hypothetical protein
VVGAEKVKPVKIESAEETFSALLHLQLSTLVSSDLHSMAYGAELETKSEQVALAKVGHLELNPCVASSCLD